jgi:hypothetical protein
MFSTSLDPGLLPPKEIEWLLANYVNIRIFNPALWTLPPKLVCSRIQWGVTYSGHSFMGRIRHVSAWEARPTAIVIAFRRSANDPSHCALADTIPAAREDRYNQLPPGIDCPCIDGHNLTFHMLFWTFRRTDRRV